MTGSIIGHSKKIIFCLLIMGFGSSALFSQKQLSGNLKQPKAHVITLSGPDRVIVDSVAGFSPRDTILLIQMQGVGITTPTSGYGFIQSIFGQPGKHEFLIIQSINTVTHEIIFRNSIIDTYDTRGNIQIVRVPYYNSATVTGKLWCDAWNSTTQKGGVLALVIGRTLKLKADIDVSTRGFKGGTDAIGVGRCILAAPTTDIDYYSSSFDNAGFKGEGIAIHDDFGTLLAPLHSKGMGPNFTGGGGGNGRFSGGGGGSNRGEGGIGGSEDNTFPLVCSVQLPGGRGGFSSEQASFPSFINRVFLGGGGGASTSLTGLTPPGGNGGGIVIIVADTIIGDGGKILANGGTGGSAITTGGSGGGGGGGSIALSVNSYGSKALTLSVTGGNGGGTLSYGEGGGGGGGFIYIKTDTPGATVTNILNGGLAPFTSGSDGLPGEKRIGFKAILNGFLFNSVRSSVTGDTLDWICSDVVPKLLTGTLPVGGSGSYTYKWQKTYNPAVPADTIDIPSSNGQNYLPTVLESTTVYFRRIIRDDITHLRDISKWVKIIVQPAITGNNIGKDTTICHGQNPTAIGSIPLNSTPSNGTGIYRYKWLQNNTNTGWDTLQVASGSPITNIGYDPPALNQTTYYKRYVQSGRCISFSNSVTTIVLNSITGNKIVQSDSVICEGFTFSALGASAPGQGSGSFLYQWQDSTTSSTWLSASGTNTLPTYVPDTSEFSTTIQHRFYRRVVLSGPHDVCKSKSQPIQLIRYPKIKNNFITANPTNLTICSGSTPVALPGSAPTDGAGAGSYSFVWQESIDGSSFGTVSGTNINYQPPSPLTAARWYRRIVNSGVYKSAPVCTSTSASTKINVDPPVLNYNISLIDGTTTQTICNGQNPIPFRGNPPSGPTGGDGIYAYQWMYSLDNSAFSTVPSGGTTDIYAPTSLTTPTFYRRDIISGACRVSSNPITITVLPLISNNIISGNPRVCDGLVPDIIKGASLSGGSGTYKYLWEQSNDGGASWIAADGTRTSSDYQAPALSKPTKYRRTVKSGLDDCCSSTSNSFDISIDPMPASPVYAGPPASVYSIDKIYHMQAINPGLVGETGTWSVLDNGKSTIDDTTRFNTIVRNLSAKSKNSFLWTVHRGLCKLSDTVTITLNEDFEPRAFSPNGDNVNDSFVIEGLDKEDNWVDLTIVNGAGTEVFSTSNRSGQQFSEWDGKNSRGVELPEGTYYYMLKVTPKDGSSPSKKSGFIILKRY
jgi:gliding motility-associated-like protein